MDDASKLKEQLYDITSQITIEPKDLQMNQKLTENQKNQKKIEDFSRRAKRVQFFEKAEQICNERHPDMQKCMSFDMNVDYNICKTLAKSFQQCFNDEKKKLMDEKSFDRQVARTNL